MEHSHIDIYCERMDGSFWSEPINALTNLAFIVAACVGYRFWKAKGDGEKDILLLIITLATVGLGSFFFHTFAQPWSLMADVLPIAVFIQIAIFSAAYRVFSLHWSLAGLVTILFFIFSLFWERNIPSDWLNGSVTYLPALAALLVMALLAKKQEKLASQPFMFATTLLIASLTFRSLDMALCSLTAGLGTHFLWHCLNGLLMFNVVKALLMGNVRKD